MVIPLKVMNRLRYGNDVAAEVPASRQGFRAWIRATPMLDPHSVVRVTYGGGEGIVQNRDGEAEWSYLIRYVEIDEQYMASIYESDAYLDNDTTIDRYFFVPSEHELTAVLGKWLTDFSALRDPVKILCPDFPSGMIPEIDVVNKSKHY